MTKATDVAVIEQRQPIMPLDIAQTKKAMDTYQSGLASILDETDWQTIDSKEGPRKFVKKSGWRKIASWCSLNTEVLSIDIDRDANGRPLRARAIARATAPNGRFADGDGACALEERRFSKPEHDLMSIATTRATNRAISNLVGLGAVSAEEIDSGDHSTPAHPYGDLATAQDTKSAAGRLQKMHPSIDAFSLFKLYNRQLGLPEDQPLPAAAVRMIVAIEWALSKAQVEPETAAETVDATAIDED